MCPSLVPFAPKLSSAFMRFRLLGFLVHPFSVLKKILQSVENSIESQERMVLLCTKFVWLPTKPQAELQ